MDLVLQGASLGSPLIWVSKRSADTNTLTVQE